MAGQSNVISLDQKRREKQIESAFTRNHEEASAASLLSLNLANWLASNFGEGAVDQAPTDLQAGLYFARGRIYYYRNALNDAARAFAIVSATAEGRELRAMTDMAYANVMFSLGDFHRARTVLSTLGRHNLTEGLLTCAKILEANVLYALEENLEHAAALYREVLGGSPRSLWLKNLQRNVAGVVPPAEELSTGPGLARLRDILDAYLEMAASRYFASLVVSLG